MQTIVLASNNKHKIKEFKEMIPHYEILSLNDIGFLEDIEENGKTFEENAKIKANTIQKYLKKLGKDYLVIADDSGLCCKALNNAPGVFSARYAGDHNDQSNRDKLRKDLQGKKKDAFFVCCLVLCYPDGETKTFEGTTEGVILEEEKGSKEFGYDCIFYSNDLGKTFGEASSEEKNSVSHRKRAIEKLIQVL